jgi:hypothetical protein
MDTLTIATRFNGPAASGNGGWTAGSLAEVAAGLGVAAPVAVRLRRPPPLDRPLDVVAVDGTVELRDREVVVAVAEPGGALDGSPPAPVDLGTARRAEAAFPGHVSHPFPRCFSCGPAREDGLAIFPGPVGGGRVAASWTPRDDLAEQDADGRRVVGTAVTWAALDCVSAWSSDLEDRPLVLASMTAVVGSPPEAGTPYVVVGATVRVEGRKTWTASALYDEAGSLLAQARHLWIAVDPTVVEQLQRG